ncbi:MAG: substrate-binding domain-containing protein, partial [Bacteroidota bacterium]
MNRLKFFFAAGISYATVFCSCSHSDKPRFTDTPTSGSITIVCDESYQPLISTEADTFTEIYRQAKINVKYLPEADAFRQLTDNDSVRLIVSARELNENEKDYFKGRKLIPRVTKIAIDAVALLMNNENPDTLLKYSQVEHVLAGNIGHWKDLNKSSKLDSIRIVFDNSSSA